MYNQTKQRSQYDSLEKILSRSGLKLALRACVWSLIITVSAILPLISVPSWQTDENRTMISIVCVVLFILPFIPLAISRLRGNSKEYILNEMLSKFGDPIKLREDINNELIYSSSLYMTDYVGGAILTKHWLILLPKIGYFGNIVSLDMIGVTWVLRNDDNNAAILDIYYREGKMLKEFKDKRSQKAKNGYIPDSFDYAITFLERLNSESEALFARIDPLR